MSIWRAYSPIGASIEAAAASRAASAAEREAARARNETETVSERLDRLALVTEALWTLLQERLGIDEKDLLDRVQALDLSDGHLDGRVKRPATPCPSCRRIVAARNQRCLYCGTELPRAPFAT